MIEAYVFPNDEARALLCADRSTLTVAPARAGSNGPPTRDVHESIER